MKVNRELALLTDRLSYSEKVKEFFAADLADGTDQNGSEQILFFNRLTCLFGYNGDSGDVSCGEAVAAVRL